MKFHFFSGENYKLPCAERFCTILGLKSALVSHWTVVNNHVSTNSVGVALELKALGSLSHSLQHVTFIRAITVKNLLLGSIIGTTANGID
jgi:hypothetical protein